MTHFCRTCALNNFFACARILDHQGWKDAQNRQLSETSIGFGIGALAEKLLAIRQRSRIFRSDFCSTCALNNFFACPWILTYCSGKMRKIVSFPKLESDLELHVWLKSYSRYARGPDVEILTFKAEKVGDPDLGSSSRWHG